MIYLFAGHHKADPGAVGNGLTEAVETIRIRDSVTGHFRKRGFTAFTVDNDRHTLGEVIRNIKPGAGDIVIDLHLNAFASKTATGCEVIIPNEYTPLEYRLGKNLAAGISSVLGIANRGVKTETQSHRGKLAILRTRGVNLLPEFFFISNPSDVAKYRKHFDRLCEYVADFLIEAHGTN